MMDLDQAPEKIREFVAELVCPVCETRKIDGILVKVMFQQPMYWLRRCECLKCHSPFGFNFLGEPPTPKPDRAAVEFTPVPSWVRGLMPSES